ncbi:TIGR03086 family metal-binding protein [Streptomyces sp. NBC_01013]|uniref:TIGR03086 family metal-binding protein n=1 Tax=Streptomyces sp. NBC_01013 TaxID=2903718 RepID=UPI00386D0B60|nr:TIGR03086 family metal-binding protein [Streptomyces sp. NBC_01013]
MELIRAASAEFERVVRQLPADSSEQPTPSGISVRELIEHVVVGNRFTALLLAGVGRGEARAMLAAKQAGDDPVADVSESAQRQAQAFFATSPGQQVAGPNGNVPVAAYLRFRLVDLVVHAWDLLRAARLDETLDPQTVLGVLNTVEPHLDEMLSFGAYGAGPSGTLPADASPQIRLLDSFGRRP